jgi:UDP-N-acetylglucosamine 2-epimerase (non-hydrolysing)
MKVLSVFGTRPEAIKMAPIVEEARRRPAELDLKVCVTGQHRGMLDQVTGLFGIVPDYDLAVMRAGQSPAQVAASVLTALEPVLRSEKPDWVLVQGDTTSAAVAALSAYFERIKVGHVEAGLRTGRKWAPFPEEINRRVAGVVADLHFAPTPRARENLLREGVVGGSVAVTGNTVVDALARVSAMPWSPDGEALRAVDWDRKLILLTIHRRESFGVPLRGVCRAVRRIVSADEGVQVIVPVHPNPAVKETVIRELGNVGRISLVEPLDYISLVHLMKRTHLILTDSGGIQEEAPTFGKPVLVLREETERPEGVDAGVAALLGTDEEAIVSSVSRLLADESAYSAMQRPVSPYGDGRAARRIVNALLGEPFAPFDPETMGSSLPVGTEA